jgi:DNA-binding response OmpR family regulator
MSEGLGIYLANAFARLHGGCIWVDDQAGPNRSFLLGLPLAGVWRRILKSERKAPLVILAVPGANRYRDLQGHLRDAGYEVITAGNLAAVSNIMQAYNPALIIMTNDLPARGAASLDNILHQAKGKGISVLQLAIMRDGGSRLLFSLAPDARLKQDVSPLFLHFNVVMLLRLLSEALNPLMTRILVVDDYSHISSENWQALRRHYHSVWIAQSTDQAIDMARSLLPNLIVAAIDHSEIDYTAIPANLRREARTDWIPMIGLCCTPLATLPPDLEDVVVCPVDNEVLLAAIDRSLRSYPYERDEAEDEASSSD